MKPTLEGKNKMISAEPVTNHCALEERNVEEETLAAIEEHNATDGIF